MERNVTSKVIAENIYYLAKFRKYDFDEICEIIGLTKGETEIIKNLVTENKIRKHFSLSVDVVAKAMRFFDVNFDDILFTDYQYLWKDQEITNYVFNEDSYE